jgi:hypothetical protein
VLSFDEGRYSHDTRNEQYVSVVEPSEYFADYLETVPPSTGNSIPVVKLLSSEARNTAADASSSAVPKPSPLGSSS